MTHGPRVRAMWRPGLVLGAAWPEDERCKDVGVRPPVRCPVRDPFARCGAVVAIAWKGSKVLRNGSKGHWFLALCCATPTVLLHIPTLARKNAEGEGGKRFPWRRSRIVGIPRAKWKWDRTAGRRTDGACGEAGKGWNCHYHAVTLI